MKFLPVNDVQRNSIDFDLGNVLATTAAVAHAPCPWPWLIFMLLSEGAVAAIAKVLLTSTAVLPY